MAWMHLLWASFFEIVFAISLKYAEGYSRLLPSIIATTFAIASIISLSKSLDSIPVGLAYSIWTGIGAIEANLLGVILFGESLDFRKLFFIAMILSGIWGLYSVVVYPQK
jgi:quaternary ammonium compound-resistance protein SugE